MVHTQVIVNVIENIMTVNLDIAIVVPSNTVCNRMDNITNNNRYCAI